MVLMQFWDHFIAVTGQKYLLQSSLKMKYMLPEEMYLSNIFFLIIACKTGTGFARNHTSGIRSYSETTLQ